MKYFEMETGVHATIKLETCIDASNEEPTIIEPLPYLLSCLSKSIALMLKNKDCSENGKILINYKRLDTMSITVAMLHILV